MKSMKRWCLLGFCLTSLARGDLSIAAETNLVGIYTDEAMSATATIAEPGDLLTVYAVLSKPHNYNSGGRDGIPVEEIGCHSFTLDLATNLEIVSETDQKARPVCDGSCTEHRACYGGMLPVGIDRRFTMVSFVLRYLGDGPAEIRLRPHSLSAFPDAMEFWYRDIEQTGWILPMYPASGGFDEPVFVVNGDQVPVKQQSWGALKAVYR